MTYELDLEKLNKPKLTFLCILYPSCPLTNLEHGGGSDSGISKWIRGANTAGIEGTLGEAGAEGVQEGDHETEQLQGGEPILAVIEMVRDEEGVCKDEARDTNACFAITPTSSGLLEPVRTGVHLVDRCVVSTAKYIENQLDTEGHQLGPRELPGLSGGGGGGGRREEKILVLLDVVGFGDEFPPCLSLLCVHGSCQSGGHEGGAQESHEGRPHSLS
ncbi:hypothetical protein E2C01_022596 [Portunus trituberculatus]|uniref:Uncharacterized protein n=1 Tax=Portunus trituberculatus TaxID=210409 RepID=A0A5B7E6E7_PORTR|nr:hypothetical protein [Portunus trituberculatus]